MADKPRDLTLERINRLTQAVADLTESHVAQGRNITRMLTAIEARLDRIEARLHAMEAR